MVTAVATRERRVVTLLPAATEMVAALGAIGSLVGVSHECDYPPAARGLPRLTTTPIDPAAPASRIDAEVRRLGAEGRAVIAVDGEALRALAPDLVVTQGLCEVCAVADGEVHRLARLMDPPPAVLSLSATTLPGISLDIRRVGEALDRSAEAEELVRELERRLARLGCAPLTGRPRRVVCIEWLEPLYFAGHWVPELVAAAGGRDVGAAPGAHSARRAWSDLTAARPDLVLVALCGFGIERARRDLAALAHAEARRALEQADVWLLDGNAYTSRPGPRVVDGAERIRAALEGRERPGLSRWRPVRTA
jgi:iron complex transport system substrate-binding protein